MKIQMQGSLTETNGIRWYAGITGEGNLVEFTLIDDTDPVVLEKIRAAVRRKAAIDIDVMDIATFRRIKTAVSAVV